MDIIQQQIRKCMWEVYRVEILHVYGDSSRAKIACMLHMRGGSAMAAWVTLDITGGLPRVVYVTH